MDRNVIYDGLSALFGVPVRPFSAADASAASEAASPPDVLTVQSFLPTLWSESPWPVNMPGLDKSKQSLDWLMGEELKGGGHLSVFHGDSTTGTGDRYNQTIKVKPICTKPKPKEILIIDEDFFDPVFDFDFTNIEDCCEFKRGGEPYERPCGWNRFALKVLGKYSGTDEWLGCSSSPKEWPVSYHGTHKEYAVGIITKGIHAGDRARFGRGVYSSPHVSVAEGYAKQFESNGKEYKLVLQNRINPEFRKVCDYKDYWLIPVPENLNEVSERDLLDKAIRPYGLLFKEMK